MIAYYIIVFIFGLIIGSFLNVCIYRIPRRESIAFPPSHCMNCGARLRPVDLVPVLSYLLLRGKCRYCGEGFSVRYSLVELLTAAVFTMLFYKYSLTVDFIFLVYLMSILIVVFFIDIDHRIIPDELVVAGFIGGIAAIIFNIFSPLQIYGDSKWWNPLLGILPGSGFLFLVAVLGVILYRTDDAMGMGDVKIFAPIGIFLGWRMCILALLFSVLLAGFSSVIMIVSGLKKKKDTIPFGPFIVTGTFITIMWGQDIARWYMNGM